MPDICNLSSGVATVDGHVLACNLPLDHPGKHRAELELNRDGICVIYLTAEWPGEEPPVTAEELTETQQMILRLAWYKQIGQRTVITPHGPEILSAPVRLNEVEDLLYRLTASAPLLNAPIVAPREMPDIKRIEKEMKEMKEMVEVSTSKSHRRKAWEGPQGPWDKQRRGR